MNNLYSWQTPLHVAVENCHSEIVELLIRGGADRSLLSQDEETAEQLMEKLLIKVYALSLHQTDQMAFQYRPKSSGGRRCCHEREEEGEWEGAAEDQGDLQEVRKEEVPATYRRCAASWSVFHQMRCEEAKTRSRWKSRESRKDARKEQRGGR